MPVLGICLGMQFLCLSSEESPQSQTLGLIPHHVRQLYVSGSPSVGWMYNDVLTPDLSEDFSHSIYCTHSYGLTFPISSTPDSDVLSTYKLDDVTSVAMIVRHDTYVGIQGHPEKSGHMGIVMLNKLVDYTFSLKNLTSHD